MNEALLKMQEEASREIEKLNAVIAEHKTISGDLSRKT
jgi:hypothetical protein